MGSPAKQAVYLDHAATTPLHPAVARVMEPYWHSQFYNPSALYLAAHETKQALETARTDIAKCLGAQPHQYIFTSGATEANNLVIHSVLGSYPNSRLLISTIEHASVRRAAEQYQHATVPVDAKGLLDLAALERQLDDSVVLVSIIHASNELGTVQPLSQVAKCIEACRQDRSLRGIDMPLLLHSDAAQSATCLDLHVQRLGVDFMTFSAHKCYGPKGVGGLFAKNRKFLQPRQLGGSQEWGLRSGTEAVPLIVGFAHALDLAQQHRAQTVKAAAANRQLLLEALLPIPGLSLNAVGSKQILPTIVSMSVAGMSGERLVLELDHRGFQVATGAACSAGSDEPSQVLRAIGLSASQAQSSLRLSFGTSTTAAQLKAFVRSLRDIVTTPV